MLTRVTLPSRKKVHSSTFQLQRKGTGCHGIKQRSWQLFDPEF